MSSMTLTAREVMMMPVEQVWQLPDGPITLTFDDGEVLNTTVRKTTYSRYIWQFNASYPDAPILANTHIREDKITKTTHLRLLSNAFRTTYHHYRAAGKTPDIPTMCKLVYEIVSMLYNDCIRRLDEYPSSITIFDFLDILDHPEIAAANDNLQTLPHPTGSDVVDVYEVIDKVLKTAPELRNNGVALRAQHKLTSLESIYQCCGPRGALSDANQDLFPIPITVGFAQGLTTLADSMMESRSSTISQMNQTKPMQDSEYSNRQLQLSQATVKNLHRIDCGSKEYIPFTISSYAHLRDIQGIRYYNEKTDSEIIADVTQTHLIGSTVRIRSIFTCKVDDKLGICLGCFGELGHSIMPDDNIGHIAATELQGPISQLVLSTKHLIGNAVAKSIELNNIQSRYIRHGSKDNALILHRRLQKLNCVMSIAGSEACNLQDIKFTKFIKTLIPSRITNITAVQFDTFDENGVLVDRDIVDVHSANRTASLTYEALAYLKGKGWSYNEKGDVLVDLREWDFTQPFFEVPLKQISTLDFMHDVDSFIKGGTTRGLVSLTSFKSPSAALMAFHDLVSTKLPINIIYLQILMYGHMVESVANEDYDLPKHRLDGEFARYTDIMFRRSMAALLAYQFQSMGIEREEAYLYEQRPPHPMDQMVL